MTIDVHTHYLPPDLAEGLRRRTEPPFIEVRADDSERYHMPIGSLELNDAYYDMDARRGFMAERGISRQILSFPGLFGVDSLPVDESFPLLQGFNDHVAALSRDHPGQFSGLAALPLADIGLAVQEFRRSRLELGLAGAILPVNAFVSTAHADAMAPLLAAADELGGHLFIHPGRRPDEAPPPGCSTKNPPFSDNMAARQALAVQDKCAAAMVTLVFSDFLDGFPNATFHVANLGGTLPMVVERMDHVALTRTPDRPKPSSMLGKVHVDCSSLGPRALEIAVHFYGADKVLFGTDCPIFLTEWSQSAVANANIEEADRDLILRGNAERLLTGLV